MLVCSRRRGPPAGGAVEVALLDQEGFDHVLDGVLLLTDGSGQGLESNRSAAELVNDGQQNPPVHVIEAAPVDFEAG